MFIVFEAIDGAGKTSQSKLLAKQTGYFWTREPTFSSEEADSLNLKSKDEYEREIEFFIDRVKHHYTELRPIENIICDRYIWSGFAYATKYNPVSMKYAKAMYKHPFFRKPDYYIFVDTPPEVCKARGVVQPIEHLYDLRKCYLETEYLVNEESKIIYTKGEGDLQELINFLKRGMNL